jgi:uncharacterized membrane protein YdjX (TVP38/TMEM64 family)
MPRLLLTLALLLIFIGVAYTLPAFYAFFEESISALSSMDVEGVKSYILGFGAWAPLVSFALMVLQSIIAPLPAFLITFANAALFGFFWGALLSWSSAMAGATLCFWLARSLGREGVERFISIKLLEETDTFFAKYGTHTILITRLLPFVSFDAVSYAAGLTSMRLLPFLLATGLGQLPATLIYSYAGETMTGSIGYFVSGLLILFALSVAWMLFRRLREERNRQVR